MRTTTLIALSLTLSACATSPGKIQPSHISTVRYDTMSCEQITGHLDEVNDTLAQIERRIEKRRTSDKIMVGVGALVAWPALFFIKGDGDVKKQYADALGERNALVRVAQTRGCVL